MLNKSYFLIRTLIFLWATVCVVVAEHQKRDVHRIIVQERVPRSHSRDHGHHKHGKKKVHSHKKAKRGSEESHSSSFEDSGSLSKENSFEDFFHGHRTHKPHYRKPSFTRHQFPGNLDVEESRHHPLRENNQPFYNSDWVPVNSDKSHSHQPPNREKDRRNKRKSKKQNQKNAQKHYGNLTNSPHTLLGSAHGKHFGDHTISHNQGASSNIDPSFPSSFASSTMYPPIDVLSAFSDLNKKLLDVNPPQLSSFDQSATNDDFDRLKNHKSNYDVHENNASDLSQEYIIVPDKSQFSSFDNFQHPEKYDPNVHSQPRGRTKFNSKF